MLFLLEASWNPKTLSGTAPRSEGGRRKACNATPPKSNSARVTISVVTATSVTFGVWVLVLVLVWLVLIKANRLACGQPVRSSLWWLLLKKRHFPQDSSVASTSFFSPLILHCCWVQVGRNRAAPPEEDASCLSADALITSTVMSLAN